jgi:hypothetical protein
VIEMPSILARVPTAVNGPAQSRHILRRFRPGA